MMNSMQPSGTLARSRLGTATKKMIALLLAAVMFFMLGVVGVMVGKADTQITDGTYTATGDVKGFFASPATIPATITATISNGKFTSLEASTTSTANKDKYQIEGNFNTLKNALLNKDATVESINNVAYSSNVSPNYPNETTFNDLKALLLEAVNPTPEEPSDSDAGKTISPGQTANIYVGESLRLQGTKPSSYGNYHYWYTDEEDVDYIEWDINNSASSYYYAGTNIANVTGIEPGTVTVYHQYVDNGSWVDPGETFTIIVKEKEKTPSKNIYSLTYDANGGTNAPSKETSSETEESTYEFTISSAKPTRDGYVFKGWASTKDLANAGTADIGNTITASSTDKDKTIYAVWEKEPEKPIEDPVPDFHKSITKSSGTDEYVLNLNVTGETVKTSSSSSETQTITVQGAADVVLVMDVSSSMATFNSNDTRQYYAEKAVDVLTDELADKMTSDGNGIRIAAVDFATTARKAVDWTTDPDTIDSHYFTTSERWDGTKSYSPTNVWSSLGDFTDWYSAMDKAIEVADSGRSNVPKYIIFISDGEPNYVNGKTDSEAYSKAVAEAKTRDTNTKLYAVAVGGSVSNMSNFANETSAEYIDGTNTAYDGSSFVEAFRNIGKTISTETTTITTKTTETHLKNVTISDTLSDNVVLNGTIKDVTVTGPDGKAVSTSDYTVTQNGKTITVAFKDSVAMKEGETYTVNIPVKPSDAAYNNYKNSNTYPNTGSANSGETSAGKQGFFSNDGATITYTLSNGPITKDYKEKPVVQVTPKEADKYSYELKFDANGGDASKLPDTQTATTENTSHKFTIPNTEPTRDHYSFQGWATSEKATAPEYKPGDTITLNNSTPDSTKSQTLYAVWKYVPETDYVLHKTSHAMFILSGLCAATAGAMFAVEHYRRKRLTP